MNSFLRRERTLFLLVVTALLMALLAALPLATVRAAAVPTFAQMDRNADGFLDGDELRRARDVARLDADGDGRVSQVEFAKW